MTSNADAATPIVTLLTDFGVSDPYVGVMKGVLLSIAPEARLVDLTHAVPPQVVEAGAFLLESAWRFFPVGTVHMIVVDPGVGTARRRIALSAQGHFFVAPDNGLLSAALPESARGPRTAGKAYKARSVALPPSVSAVTIENERLFRRPVSATFEGRDVFAPAAAHLAAGAGLQSLGPTTGSIEAFAAFRAPQRNGVLEGLVIHADHFGNLITDIRADDLPPAPVFIAGGRHLALAATYAAIDVPAAIVSSGGFIELAAPNGHAARILGIGPGDHVRAVSA